MDKLIRCYKFLQLISIDIAIGSAILSMSVAHVLKVYVPSVVYLALFLCVWMIYTLDHLLDAKKVRGIPSMERHVFHQKHGQTIFYVLLATAMTSLSLLFYIPIKILLFGAITAGVVSGYFMLTWWVKVFVAKELVISILYGIGVCLAPFALSVDLDYVHLIIFLELVILAFTNLLIFSYFEEQKDRTDGCHSWATIFGETKTVNYIRWVLFLGALIISIGSFLFMTSGLFLTFQILLLCMWVILVAVFLLKEYLIKHDQYRFLGDVVFMLPGLVFFA